MKTRKRAIVYIDSSKNRPHFNSGWQMDISNSTNRGQVASSSALNASVLAQFSQPQKAQVLEVVELSRSQMQELLNKQVLSDSLSKQLLNHLKIMEVQSRQLTESTSATLSLVKAAIAVASKTESLWLLSELSLAKGATIALVRKGNSLVVTANTTNTSTIPTDNGRTPHNQALAVHQKAQAASLQGKTLNLEGLTSLVNSASRNVSLATLQSNPLGPNNLLSKSDASNAAIRNVLNLLLKHTLPIQDQHYRFLNASKQIANSQQTIVRLATQSRQPELRQLAGLIQAIDNVKTKLPQFQSITSGHVNAALHQSGALRSALSPSAGNEQNASSLDDQKHVENVKALLESAISLFRTLGTAAASFSKADTQLFDALVRILSGLVPNQRSSQRGDQKDASKQALRALEQLAANGLARVLANQARTALQSTFSELPTQQVHVETDILARHHDNVLPVHISLREERRSGNLERKETKTSKTWVVFLEWELEDCGSYHTEIRVRENTVTAKIWNEKPYIRQRLRNNISKLHDVLIQNGVDVESITCEDAPLTKRAPNLQHNLVDVRT